MDRKKVLGDMMEERRQAALILFLARDMLCAAKEKDLNVVFFLPRPGESFPPDGPSVPNRLKGVVAPGILGAPPVKLTAYVDDVTVVLRDICEGFTGCAGTL